MRCLADQIGRSNLASCQPSLSAMASYTALRSPKDYPSPPSSRHSRDSDSDSLRALEISDGPEIPATRFGRGRSYSVSGFEFDLLPLSASVADPEMVQGENAGEKSIGLVNGIALIVGLQIGSGIFSSPGVVVANTHSVGASLIVWAGSGLLGWTGASSFAELGSAIPQNGGAQAYLAYAYGPLVSYLFAWTAIIALKPGGNAVISLIFAEYLNRIFWHTTRADVSPDDIPQWAIKITAIAAIALVTLFCVAARKLGTRVAVVFTTIKVAALISITILGIVQLARGKQSTSLTEPLFSGSSTSPSSYSLAFYSGLWAFDGWDQANYVGGEIKNPEKNIPRTIHSSMAIVTLLFLLANLSYFVVLDKNTISLSNTVAMDFGRALFGPIGGTIFALMVAISCFGALNGSFYTSSRLVYAAGREGYLPAMFGRLHTTRKTPLNASLLQAAITTAFILIGGSFRSLINFSVVASWAFYFLTVLGLVILRVKEPMLERPYKTWIITPLTFCAVALFLLCMPIIAAPLPAVAVLGFVLAGIPVYYITHRSERELPRVFGQLISRLRGRPPAGDGWEAVATEGDEPIEMAQSDHTR
ncbi:amino acid permease-domain-containing protein [Mycena maculata]|uniref:Amino acid permease-domain-containing protein n=1 Tax=Mycena maculata TaxID=230809 RepID=A0AAD7K0T8_9AGAR|nr:amino acid permease-domain-containing protein [Mycena maculata]